MSTKTGTQNHLDDLITDASLRHLITLEKRSSWRIHELPPEINEAVLRVMDDREWIECRFWYRGEGDARPHTSRIGCNNADGWFSPQRYPGRAHRLPDVISRNADDPDLASELHLTDRGKAKLAELNIAAVGANFNRLPAGNALADAQCRHGLEFRSVNWSGTEYSFTLKQASAVAVLWEQLENGTPDVPVVTLMERAGIAEKSDFRDTFKGNSAWGTMIIGGRTKGTYRLADPAKKMQKPEIHT